MELQAGADVESEEDKRNRLSRGFHGKYFLLEKETGRQVFLRGLNVCGGSKLPFGVTTKDELDLDPDDSAHFDQPVSPPMDPGRDDISLSRSRLSGSDIDAFDTTHTPSKGISFINRPFPLSE